MSLAPITLERILALYADGGARLYGGEEVTQLEHALQCAQLAEQAGAGAELVAAALLHDIGHLVASELRRAPLPGADDTHEELGARFLRALFPQAVLEPIRLHVDAKRYLCFSEPGYWDSLSAASKRSLELQGGPFGAEGARYFFARGFAADAVRLRRWDEQAKASGARTAPLEHYVPLLKSLAARGLTV